MSATRKPAPSEVGAEREPRINNIIGVARTIQTAVLVCEYLKLRCCSPQGKVHASRISYRFKEPCEANGYWSADILISGELPFPEDKPFIEACRAFVAGRGEIWT